MRLASSGRLGLTSATVSLLGGLLGSCGGGGGDAREPGPATVEFVLASEIVSEDGGPLSIEVRLHTEAPLVEPLDVRVLDAGSGTATAGLDYERLSPVTLTFPSGAAEDERRTVVLQPLPDALVEAGDETVVLELADPVGGELGVLTAFTTAITDADEARISFTAATTSSIDEHTGPRSIAIELDLDPGVRLDVPVDANVSDLLTGSATSGVDYSALPALRVVFPRGATDGLVRAIAVQVLDDAEAEGAETVRLMLSGSSSSVQLGSDPLHQLVIQDDDVAGSSTLAVSMDSGGTEVPLGYGQLVDLGSRTLDAGPGPEVTLRARNSGTGLLDVGVPQLAGAGRGDFALTYQGFATAREARATVPLDQPFPFEPVPGDGGPGVALRSQGLTDAARPSPAALVWHGVPVPDLGPVALDLQRVPLPVAADAVVTIDGVALEGGLRTLVGELELWSGTILGLEGSRAFLMRHGRRIEGRLELPVGDRRIVEIVPDDSPGVDARVLRPLADDGERWPGGGDFCQPSPSARALDPGSLAPPTDPQPAVLSGCRLALETDHALYQKFGSSGALGDYLVGLIASVGDRFLTDVGVRLSIAYLGIHTTADDGWTTPDNGGTPGQLLSEFKAAWDGGWPADADLAHFLSGARLGGGSAFADVLCDPLFGYAVSADLRGNLDWATWDGQSSTATWDFVVVAHELGHGFGALHTHDYCPPIDRCVDNCSGSMVCSQGTLMSYCHLCSGGLANIDLDFHPFTANVMRGAVNRSCLPPAALQPDELLFWSLQFAPTSTVGTIEAILRFPHTATNEPRPFEALLRGESL
jgi:hypothetical protein